MFEKEAKKYLENFADCVNCKERWGGCSDSLDEYCLVNGACYATPKEQDIYIAGAEFGYNKANEWHYVKDGDYPKDNKPVLCILGDIDSENSEVGYYNDVGSGEPWHFETYLLPDDDGDNAWGVSAWKEIVLPKENE